ncbi:hypothetical protein NFI96_026225, partial [Prochilodus magdalenae]
ADFMYLNFFISGQVLDSRTQSPWRLSFFSDLFWGVVEFIGLFFQTIVQPDLSKDGNSGSSSRFSDGRGRDVSVTKQYSSRVPRAETHGKNKPWRRSYSSSNGWWRMRKVNACTQMQA